MIVPPDERSESDYTEVGLHHQISLFFVPGTGGRYGTCTVASDGQSVADDVSRGTVTVEEDLRISKLKNTKN